MKVYTFYTDSHASLLNEHFIPSYKKYNSNIELIVDKFDQECATGSYMADGWMTTMHRKIDQVIRSIEENWGNIFVHSDCDVQFFGNIKDDLIDQLEDNDICGIDECPSNPNAEICCGFFIARGNDKTLSLFKEVKKIMNNTLHDQHAFNHLKSYFVKHKKLNYKYYNVAHDIGGRLWNPGMPISPKKDVLVHHANWIVGVENKIINMNVVKDLVLK